jgi:hypothetical protein
VKDEYSAGVVAGGGMEVDGDVGVSHAVPQTIQHHPPPSQFSLGLQQQQSGKNKSMHSKWWSLVSLHTVFVSPIFLKVVFFKSEGAF